MKDKITRHTDLKVYRLAFDNAMNIFRESRTFPQEERYSLTDQIRRSSRSVAANITEGWRKRRYSASFVSKLNDAEGEAAETQTWLQFAAECGYLTKSAARKLYKQCDEVIAMLVHMQNHPEQWVLTTPKRTSSPLAVSPSGSLPL